MGSLLDKIKSSGGHFKDTFWPGTEIPIRLRVLNCQDLSNVQFKTDEMFKTIGVVTHNYDDYNAERETRMLFYAISDSEGKQLFNNISDFRKCLTTEIKDVLAEESDALQDEYAPNPDKMSDEDFDNLVVRVKKNAKEELGNISNIHTLRRLSLYLVSQPVI